MKFRVTCALGVPAAIFALATATGVQHGVSAATGLSQEEAEKVSSNIYIANCHPPQAGLTRTVTLGKPDPNGHIREKYGPADGLSGAGDVVGKLFGAPGWSAADRFL